MSINRFLLSIALFPWCISIAFAEDYVVPSGVTVLTEEQLFKQIIGNTMIGGDRWAEYFEPATNNPSEGRIKGVESGSPYGGTWTINKSLLCWHYDKAFMKPLNDCYTIALDGDILTWYKADGSIHYPNPSRPKLAPGTPRNL